MSVGSAEGGTFTLGKCIGNAKKMEKEWEKEISYMRGSRNPKLCSQSSSTMGRVTLEEMKMLFVCLGTETCMFFFPLSASGNENGPLKPSTGNSDSNAYKKDEAILLLLFC